MLLPLLLVRTLTPIVALVITAAWVCGVGDVGSACIFDPKVGFAIRRYGASVRACTGIP